MRTEILNEWFFPATVRVGKYIIPAPAEVIQKRDELRENWLKPHPRLPKEEPMVCVSPGEQDGQSGYYVRTAILLK